MAQSFEQPYICSLRFCPAVCTFKMLFGLISLVQELCPDFTAPELKHQPYHQLVCHICIVYIVCLHYTMHNLLSKACFRSF